MTQNSARRYKFEKGNADIGAALYHPGGSEGTWVSNVIIRKLLMIDVHVEYCRLELKPRKPISALLPEQAVQVRWCEGGLGRR